MKRTRFFKELVTFERTYAEDLQVLSMFKTALEEGEDVADHTVCWTSDGSVPEELNPSLPVPNDYDCETGLLGAAQGIRR